MVLVNPLVDGMNLVAKEAAVVSERDAVLVLSETAGAYDQMADGVLPVAPADVAGTAEALAHGTGHARSPSGRDGMRGLRRGVEREDIGWWLRAPDWRTWRGSARAAAARLRSVARPSGSVAASS